MKTELALIARAFDAESRTFDAKYASSWAMRALRLRFRMIAARLIPPGSRLLELGAGTGEETLAFSRMGFRILATDPSLAMLKSLDEKLRQAGLAVETAQASTRSLSDLDALTPFDGAFAFLGPINYEADLRAFASNLARLLRPGAVFVFSVMNPYSAWEIVTGLARLNSRAAFRRLDSRGVIVRVGGQELRAYCHSFHALAEELDPYFEPAGRWGLGLFVPPAHFDGHIPMVLRPLLERFEKRFGGLWPLAFFADQFVLALRRRRA